MNPRSMPFWMFLFIVFSSCLIAWADRSPSTPPPLDFTQQARLVTGVPSDDYANTGVAISSNMAVVASANGYFVYVRSGTTWSQQTVLVPSDGMSVCTCRLRPIAIESDTIVVGCALATINGNSQQGAAYVFVRSGNTWTEQQRLSASDGVANDRFGLGVAISGNTIIVGDPEKDVGASTDQGSAYVFLRSETSDGANRRYSGQVMLLQFAISGTRSRLTAILQLFRTFPPHPLRVDQLDMSMFSSEAARCGLSRRTYQCMTRHMSLEFAATSAARDWRLMETSSP